MVYKLYQFIKTISLILGLNGKNEFECAKADMLADCLEDVFKHLVKIFSEQNAEEKVSIVQFISNLYSCVFNLVIFNLRSFRFHTFIKEDTWNNGITLNSSGCYR